MRKVLLLSSGQALSRNSLDFAFYLGKGKGLHLNGLFFSETNNRADADWDSDTVVASQTATSTAPAIAEFESAVKLKGFHYNINVLEKDVLKEIHEQSKFADLMICDAGLSPVNSGLGLSPFVRQVLAGSKCPVVVAPVKFDDMEEIIFTYDGSDMSMYAIKQFTYLFPDFGETPVSVLRVIPSGSEYNEKKDKLVDFLKYHYNSISFTTLEGEDAEIALFRQFIGKKNIMLVMGAYGRKMILNERSTADILLRNIDTPMFIAHF